MMADQETRAEGTTALRAVISGRVQGVWYRAWTVETATRLGLSGWVRNRLDGTVEALFCGPAELVHRMIEACRSGPPDARVAEVDVEPGEPPAHEGFLQWDTV